MIKIKIDPIPKPRMVKSDKYKKRPVVLNYWAFKDELSLKCKVQNVELGEELHVDFYIKMPKSWSKKKKAEMYLSPHKQTPDIDNLTKSLMDCLLKEDSHIWSINARKFWYDHGAIIFY